MINEKKQELVGKLVDGATALNEFFDTILVEGYSNPMKLARKLGDQYDLNSNQRRRFNHIARKMRKVRKITKYLQKKYGANRIGAVQGKANRERLYRELNREEYEGEDFSANIGDFSIMFDLPDNHFDTENHQLAKAGSYCLYDERLDEAVRCINQGRDLPEEMMGLVYKVSQGLDEQARSRSPEENLLLLFTEGEIDPSMARVHEMKHVIDNITAEDNGYVKELSAHLYSECIPKKSFFERAARLDALPRLERAEKRKKRFEEAETMPGKRVFVKYEQARVDQATKIYEDVRDKCYDIVKDIYDLGLGTRELSFVVSGTDPYKLRHRLELIRDYLKERKG